MTDRDYAVEMSEWIVKSLPDGDYTPTILAADILTDLQQNDPDLLGGWLMLNAGSLITSTLRGMRAKDRANNRRSAGRGAFSDAADRFAAGDAKPLRSFLDTTRHRIEGGVNRKLGDMTAADCLYVADKYAGESRTLEFQAVFLQVLARKIGNGTVRDTYDNEKLRVLQDNIARAHSIEVA